MANAHSIESASGDGGVVVVEPVRCAVCVAAPNSVCIKYIEYTSRIYAAVVHRVPSEITQYSCARVASIYVTKSDEATEQYSISSSRATYCDGDCNNNNIIDNERNEWQKAASPSRVLAQDRRRR